MRKTVVVTLFYLKPNKKKVIYAKPYKWRTTFKNAKEFNKDDVVPFVGSDNHKHYGFVYKKEIYNAKDKKGLKWLIPYDSNSKTHGRRLKRLYYNDWEEFKNTNLDEES